MKILKSAVLATMLVSTSVMAQTNETDVMELSQGNDGSMLGAWESDEKDVRMEYFKDGDHYSGRLLWGNRVIEADGSSKKDTKNPDASLRSRDILGQVTLTGLKWNGSEYTGGKIYDPSSGKTYNCKAWVEGGKLHLRGYLGISLLGQTVTWHRYASVK